MTCLKAPESWKEMSLEDKIKTVLLQFSRLYKYSKDPHVPKPVKTVSFWLAMLDKVEVVPSTHGTFATKAGKVGIIYVSEQKAENPVDEMWYLLTAILHETLHLSLKHLERTKKLLETYGSDAHLVANVAADVVVNSLLTVNDFPLVPGSVGNGIGTFEVRGERVTFHFGDVTVEDVLSKTFESIFRQLYHELPEPPHVPPPSYALVHEKNERENGNEVCDLFQKAYEFSKAIGNVPLGVKREVVVAQESSPPALINVLLSFATTSSGYRESLNWNVLYRHSPPNLCLPCPRTKKEKLWIVIDTSGSMSENALSRIFSVLSRLSDYVSFDLYFHDTELYECPVSVKDKRTLRKALEHVKGGGGTDYRPIFEEARKEGVKKVVVFTDGYGIYPTRSFPNTLWVIVGRNEDSLPPFGRIYFL